MFQSLRSNNQIYVLHKEEPSLEIGSIVNVSMPIPKYPNTFGTTPEMVVDITAKINGEDVTYQRVPATLEIADFGTGGIVLADNKEAINSEIASIKQKSLDIINSVDYHKDVVENCDKLLSTLNPEFAERQAQQDEIKTMREQIKSITQSIADLVSELRAKKE